MFLSSSVLGHDYTRYTSSAKTKIAKIGISQWAVGSRFARSITGAALI
jgi:hypothetical protein